MAHTWMKNFSRGLDARRSPVVSGDEVLTRAHDLHITSSGDLEQRANFVRVFDGHPAVIGYVPHRGGVCCVVRSKDDNPDLAWSGIRPTGLPARFTVVHVGNINLGAGGEATPERIVSHAMKGGRGFFVVEFSGGLTRMFGCPETGSGDAEPPTFVYYDASDDAVQSAVRYVRNPLTNKGIMTEVDAFRLLLSKGWSGTRPVEKIASMPKYGKVENVYVRFRDMAGVSPVAGQDPVYTVAGGTFDVSVVERSVDGYIVKYEKVGDEFFVSGSVSNADAYVNATVAYVHYSEIGRYPASEGQEQENARQIRLHKPSVVHAIARKLVMSSSQTTMFSGISDPLAFYPDIITSDTPNPGAGFVDMSSEVHGSGPIRGYATYDKRLAVFFDNETQIWDVDVDVSNTRIVQTVPGGTRQGKSIINTAQDVFYVDRTGIRSLRSRDSSGALTVDDAGAPINDLVRGRTNIVSARDPESGRLFFCSGNEIFVLSIYPGQQSAAWSTYSCPLSVIGSAEGFGRTHLYGEGGVIYAYGSPTEDTPYRYGDSEPVAHLPWISSGDPSARKVSKSIDASVEGEWHVYMSSTPQDPEAEDKIAEIDYATYDEPIIPMASDHTHIQLRFVCKSSVSATVPARLESVTIHFETAKDAK